MLGENPRCQVGAINLDAKYYISLSVYQTVSWNCIVQSSTDSPPIVLHKSLSNTGRGQSGPRPKMTIVYGIRLQSAFKQAPRFKLTDNGG